MSETHAHHMLRATAIHNDTKALLNEAAVYLRTFVDNCTYETEYDGRMYSQCVACGEQNEHAADCETVKARALLAKI